MSLRNLREDEVSFEVGVAESLIPVRGNAMQSGDEALDKQVEDEILARIDQGDTWAWAHITVTATWNGITGVDRLGGCSHKDEQDFQDVLLPEMKKEALADLNVKVRAAFESIMSLVVPISRNMIQEQIKKEG